MIVQPKTFFTMKNILIPLVGLLIIMYKPVSAQNFALPFKTDDLKPYERMYTGDHAAGIQGEGEDLGMVRYLGNNKWTSNKEGTDGTKNSDKIIYGKPVYAMSDGKII